MMLGFHARIIAAKTNFNAKEHLFMKKLFLVCMASFLLFALGSCKPPVSPPPKDDGKKPPKVTVTVTQPSNGTITLSGSGVPADISTPFEVAKGSELTVTLKANKPEQKAASLKIGDTEYTTANDDGEDSCIIVKKCKVETSLAISGTITDKEKFTVTVTQPTGGKISITENTNELSGSELENILEGTKLTVTLKATTADYEVNFLKINDKPYKDKQDGKIVHTFALAENVSVSGGVSKPINQAATTLKTLTIDGKSISFDSSSIDCGETTKESVSVECTTSDDANTKVSFDPALDGEKWTLDPNTVNTLKITLHDKMDTALVNEYTVSLTQYQEHKVSVTQPTGGTIAVFEKGRQLSDTDLKKVRHGTALTFTVQPAPGLEVKNWSGAEQNSSDPTQATATITEGVTVTCTLQKKQYTISFEPPENGTISATKKNGEPFTSGKKAEYGDTIIFTVTPAGGFVVLEWNVLVDGKKAPFFDRRVGELTVTGDTTVSVTLEKTVTPTVTITPEDGASCEIEIVNDGGGISYSSPLVIVKGQTCRITVKPKDGYKLDRVEINGVKQGEEDSRGHIVFDYRVVTDDFTITITAQKTLDGILNDAKVTPLIVEKTTSHVSLIGEGITWKADHEEIITTTPGADLGKVTHPESITVVKLTATAEKNGETKKKTFSVTVIGSTSGASDDQAILDALEPLSKFDGGIYDLAILPNTADNRITWESSDPRFTVDTAGKKLTVIPDFKEYTLRLTATLGSATRTFSVTIDKVKKLSSDYLNYRCKITDTEIEITYSYDGKIFDGNRYSYTLDGGKKITVQKTHKYIPGSTGGGNWYDYDGAKTLMINRYRSCFRSLKELAGKESFTLAELKAAFNVPVFDLPPIGEMTEELFYGKMVQHFTEVPYTDFTAKTPSEQTALLKTTIDVYRQMATTFLPDLNETASWDQLIEKAPDLVKKMLGSFEKIAGTYEFSFVDDGKLSLTTRAEYKSGEPWYKQHGSYHTDDGGSGTSIELSPDYVSIGHGGNTGPRLSVEWNQAFTHCIYHDPDDPSKNFKVTITDNKNGTIQATFSGSESGAYPLTFKGDSLLD